MRLFAIETNVEELKKKFIVENEKAVHVTHMHFLAFLVNIFWQTIMMAILAYAVLFGMAQGIIAPDFGFWTLVVFGLIYAYFFSSAHVAWKCNFIIITTQKVVLVEQRSMFFQKINPVHFTNINNTRVESQFAGIFKCGVLFIELKIGQQGGAHVQLKNEYVPKPNDIAAIIEHGIIMNEKPIKVAEEQHKKEAMQGPAIDSGNPQPELLQEDQSAPQKTDGIGLGAAIAGEAPPPEKI